MRKILFMLLAVFTFSVSACTPYEVNTPDATYSKEYCEKKADAILQNAPDADPFDTLQTVDIQSAALGYITTDDLNMLVEDCRKNGIPFSAQLLGEYLPLNGSCKYSEMQRYNRFIEELRAFNRTEEQDALESFAYRTGKAAVRDCNADMLATTYATVGHNYQENVAWDLNRVGVSDGRILALDAYMANYYYTSNSGDGFVEFEPDGIIWLSEVSGGNWLIGTEYPIYVDGVAYGPFGWGNELVYDPTPSNESFNECGQIVSFVDGNVIGPIGGGVTAISVYGVVPPQYPFGCSE